MRQGKIGLTFIFITVIALAVILSVSLTILGDAESQLKEEYITDLDGVADLSPSYPNAGENTKFKWGTLTSAADDYINIVSLGSGVVGDSADDGLLTIKYNLYGLETAVIVKDARYGLVEGIPVHTPSDGSNIIFLFKPQTLDLNKVDISKNGVIVKTLVVQDPFYITISTEDAGSINSYVNIDFIGHKSRFCDVRGNEVWVRESFASPIRITDLERLGLPYPTQFCHEARPFTFKNSLGEAPLSKQEGILPFNRGDFIPSRNLVQGELITINYATPIERCQSNGCSVCGLGEANVRQSDGRFKCVSYIQEASPRTITQTQVITSDKISFLATSNNFNIGTLNFATTNNFNCGVTDEGLYSPPNPSDSCYTGNINIGGNAYKLAYGSEISTNGLKLKYLPVGNIRKDEKGIENNLVASYLISVDKVVSYSIQEIADNILSLQIYNHLPENSITLRMSQRILAAESNLPDNYLTLKLKSGSNRVDIPLNKENIGINELKITSTYKTGEITLTGDTLTFGYEVKTQENPATREIVKYVVIHDTSIDKYNPITAFFNKIIAWIKNLFA